METNNPDKGKPKLLLNIQEAAEALGISQRKLWGMTDSRQIPHVRLGRCLRYPVRELEQWINEHMEGSCDA
ncbi:MAG: helix-turn-helix domain-containing protein [Dehalococcoidia bacterium]|nr:helix-turn-helix domain-containing protein [Dehalococcoidia bacterium]